jgi:hypothetical protein
VTPTTKLATVSLGYTELMTLVGELDIRAHDLALQAEDARRHNDARAAAACVERCEDVRRLLEYFHMSARTLVLASAPTPPVELHR